MASSAGFYFAFSRNSYKIQNISSKKLSFQKQKIFSGIHFFLQKIPIIDETHFSYIGENEDDWFSFKGSSYGAKCFWEQFLEKPVLFAVSSAVMLQ